MSTPPSPTDSPTTNSSDNYPLDLFAPELSDIVMDPEMIGPIHDADETVIFPFMENAVNR